MTKLIPQCGVHFGQEAEFLSESIWDVVVDSQATDNNITLQVFSDQYQIW